MSEQPAPPIRGDVLDEDTFDQLAEIDSADIESAAEWWDLFASAAWVGALDAEPIDDATD